MAPDTASVARLARLSMHGGDDSTRRGEFGSFRCDVGIAR
jgi:hypothetical protein